MNSDQHKHSHETPDYPDAREIRPETQKQRPGHEDDMKTKPIYDDDDFAGFSRLKGKVALITGGDSGIGRAVAVAYAKEGAHVVINYKEETDDAMRTKADIEAVGADCLLVAGDIGDSAFCQKLVDQTIERFGQLDILVNNAAEQHPVKSLTDLTDEQLLRTFKTNIFSMFYLTRAALPHLKEGSSVINTASVTAYRGSSELLDYSSTKGAITSFTRSLAEQLAEKKIRVNQVAPGPIWTPLIPSTFEKEKVDSFGSDTPMKRPGQPLELAEAYVFLAWERASSYITGQTIHINGGGFLTS